MEENLPGRCSLGSSRVLSRLQGASVWESRVGLASCDNGVPSAPLFWVYKQLRAKSVYPWPRLQIKLLSHFWETGSIIMFYDFVVFYSLPFQ